MYIFVFILYLEGKYLPLCCCTNSIKSTFCNPLNIQNYLEINHAHVEQNRLDDHFNPFEKARNLGRYNHLTEQNAM